jgi:hypothetical protein
MYKIDIGEILGLIFLVAVILLLPRFVFGSLLMVAVFSGTLYLISKLSDKKNREIFVIILILLSLYFIFNI